MISGALLLLVLALAMAWVTNPGQLITLRTLQGIFCGTVSASMALVATLAVATVWKYPIRKDWMLLGKGLGAMAAA